MDFFRVCTKEARGGVIDIYPDFTVGRSKDLMVRGQSFYAIWNEDLGLWSTDEYDVTALVDRALLAKAEELKAEGIPYNVKLLSSNSTNGWNQYKKYIKNASDNSHQLDMKLTFSNTEVKKSDYVSRRLPYSLAPGDYSAWDELVGVLYNPEEREKIEWAIGAIISGDSKKIEKFLVFYGPGGTGKSTIMKIIQKLFPGYIAMFEAKALVGNNNTFATEAFKSNPLVAIQHDGDLSKIEDNSMLNSVVGHDPMRINEKYKSGYEMVLSAMLFMGTNKPVKITDAKSGLIRRLIDVEPSLRTLEYELYQSLMARINFELGAIAQHCLDVYKSLGKSRYSNYRPSRMMMETDPFHNFVEEHFDVFRAQDGTTLKQSWELYKAWSEEVKLGYSLKQYQFREKLKDYFNEFLDRATIDGVQVTRVYRGFNAQQFKTPIPESKPKAFSLVMDGADSILDEMYAGLPAQYPGSAGTPAKYWDFEERISKKTGEPFIPTADQVCSTVLGDLDTGKLHYLKVPEHHIVVDFDLKDEDGKKSLKVNEEAAASWKPTYAEVSKSGGGVHLHYIYDGDVSELASEYSPGIEIKVFTGNMSLRRKLTKCNNVSVATISSGLPFREKKPMSSKSTLQSEKGLRDMIMRNLRKEFHSSTKSSVDFIEKILSDAHKSGMIYDVSDMRSKILAFAVNSTNQQEACVKAITRMEFKSEGTSEDVEQSPDREPQTQGRIVFFDCEVYPNLFVICWKYQGTDTVVRMINPTPMEVEKLLYEFKLVGFNNRSYDNHIMYARYLGATNEELYRLSQRIMNNDDTAKYGEAWNLSYADVYDFSSDKMSLKKWEILLGIKHMEMDIPWDKPVPKNRIKDVVDYCANDVNALEAVFDACKQDFVARQILADMSGLSVNTSTRQHVMRILFGNEKSPQKDFVYTDLSEMFPGYEFDEFAKKDEKSKYRGEFIGEGGYVYAEPGIHKDVALLDIASMHPTSIIELNLFGPYTAKFQRLLDARLAIKNGNYKKADELIPGVEVNEENAKALANALKLVLNSTYGYTCAKFANPARDPRNKDNIVAKRGALFMVDLKHAVQEQGFTVAHIKTDSIKIPDATPDIIAFVQEFGAKYGYTFEHEATYSKMCLVNDAVYVAKIEETDPPGAYEYQWTATGAEFKHPYVFKALFSKEPVTFKDLCETKQVKKGAMYLRFPEGEKVIGDKKDEALPENELAEADPGYGDTHIGRSGLFVPINPDQDFFTGGDLICVNGEKESFVQGTKNYKWAEAEMIRALQDGAIDRMVFERLDDAVEGTGSIVDVIDMAYYTALAESAYQSIKEFGDAEEFLS